MRARPRTQHRAVQRAPTAQGFVLLEALYTSGMSIVDRIKRLFGGEGRNVDTHDTRIDKLTSTREGQALTQNEGGGIPPGYLPTGVDEGRPKK
jgi:hypothetical protein